MAKKGGLASIGAPGMLITTKEEYKEIIMNNTPSKTKFKWWCGKREHESWQAVPNSISQGTWCPYCSEGQYEHICRWYFKQIFKNPFEKTVISTIIKDTKRNMHFDGYSEIIIDEKVIKLAFEFNGYQHYIWPNIYHKTEKEFIQQQQLDTYKKRLCIENMIILIIFPYNISLRMNEPKKIQDYIIKEFRSKTGIELSDIIQYDYQKKNKD